MSPPIKSLSYIFARNFKTNSRVQKNFFGMGLTTLDFFPHDFEEIFKNGILPQGTNEFLLFNETYENDGK